MSRHMEVSAGAERGGSPTYTGVQALRAAAACAVVVYHAGRVWAENYGLRVPYPVSNGASGVDVFFAISGFVMALSATGSRRPSAGEFLRRRIVRVVPLYWLMTLVAVGKLLLVAAVPGLGSAADHAPVRALDVVRSLLLVPYVNPVGQVLPILQPGWTISYEMFFYLLFAGVLLVSKARPVRVLGPLLAALAVLGCFRRTTWPVWTELISPMLLEFLGGVLLGTWVRAGLRLSRWAAGLLSLFGVAAVGLLGGGNWGDPAAIRVFAWGVPAFVVVVAAVLLEDRLRIPFWVQRVGDASYSLYLSHMLVGLFCAWVARRVFGIAASDEAGLWIFCGVTSVVSVVVALKMFEWVERPMTRTLGSWTGRAKPGLKDKTAG